VSAAPVSVGAAIPTTVPVAVISTVVVVVMVVVVVVVNVASASAGPGNGFRIQRCGQKHCDCRWRYGREFAA
jgi:hypothetical protein